MTFTGTVVKHEQVILFHPATGTIVDARAAQDQTLRLGESAYFDISVVRGLPVQSATVNVNMWDVFKADDPGLADRLLDRIFEKKENN